MLRNSVEDLRVTVRVCLSPTYCDLSEIPQIIPLRVSGLLLACRALTPQFTADNSDSPAKGFIKDKKLKF